MWAKPRKWAARAIIRARLWLGLIAILLLGQPTAVAGGVEGLLAISRSRLQSGHVAEFFSGRVLGVDLSVWLYQVAHLLACDRSAEHMAVIADILVKRAQRLSGLGVTLVMVADCPTTSKEAERARRRAAKMAAVRATEPHGDEEVGINEMAEDDAETGMSAEPPASAAVSTDVSTPAALGPLDVHGAFQTIVLARMAAAGFARMMAPQEADHQLAYLCLLGLIHAVITVDSDLLVLGGPQLVIKLQTDGACSVIALADMSRPLAAPQSEYVDPLGWLCAARELGGEARGDAQVAAELLLVACVAPSDFNHIPGVGLKRSRDLVVGSRAALAAALAAAPDDERGAVLLVIISASPSAFVDAVYEAHAKYCKPSALLSKSDIVAGMQRALIVFTRSLCFDSERGVERPLTGAAAQTDDEIAITGRACADPEKASDLAMFLRTRTFDGEHPLILDARLPDRVCPRGMSEPQRITYVMLPPRLRGIFELDASIVAQADMLKSDLSARMINLPGAITVDDMLKSDLDLRRASSDSVTRVRASRAARAARARAGEACTSVQSKMRWQSLECVTWARCVVNFLGRLARTSSRPGHGVHTVMLSCR